MSGRSFVRLGRRRDLNDLWHWPHTRRDPTPRGRTFQCGHRSDEHLCVCERARGISIRSLLARQSNFPFRAHDDHLNARACGISIRLGWLGLDDDDERDCVGGGGGRGRSGTVRHCARPRGLRKISVDCIVRPPARSQSSVLPGRRRRHDLPRILRSHANIASVLCGVTPPRVRAALTEREVRLVPYF